MKTILTVLLCLIANLTFATTFHIGNSLTWDTKPNRLPDSEWTIFCNKSLDFINDNPSDFCISSSLEWPDALANNSYDIITVQPFYPDTAESASTVISSWMALQPQAKFIIHTGWSGSSTLLENYENNTNLIKDLIENLPRSTTSTYALEALVYIANDPNSPYGSISEIYRDPIHMTLGDGRYLMHNIMRRTLGLPLVSTWLDTIDHKDYLDSILAKEDYDWDGDTDGSDFLNWQRSYAGSEGFGWGENTGDLLLQSVPEPTSLMLLGIACCYGISRRQRRTA